MITVPQLSQFGRYPRNAGNDIHSYNVIKLKFKYPDVTHRDEGIIRFFWSFSEKKIEDAPNRREDICKMAVAYG